MGYKNIILDWSGTLVDDFTPVFQATNEIFVHYGHPIMTLEEFRENFFLPFPKFYEKYIPQAKMIELEVHYHRAFHSLQGTIQPLPRTLEFLNFCKDKGLRLFLLSTIHKEHYKVQSELLGLSGYFEKAYVQIMDKAAKIHEILVDNNLHPEETMFVGDMQHDIDTAHHGGITGVAVLTGYDSLHKLKRSNPHFLFQNLSGLKGYLERHVITADAPPISTVGALIFNLSHEVLMVRTHKWSNKWGIPGGKIKANEPAELALKREILEETGLAIDKIRFELVQDCIQPEEFFRKAHFILLNYSCHTSSNEVTLNDEAFEFRWVSLAEAKNLDLNIPTRVLLNHYTSQSHV
ncbi:MAG: HAD hydrolase-like protein [Verrucomicrobiota bacterium]|nr:HAD hydrolase-like protein [Verrucomicrobiota bacterium]